MTVARRTLAALTPLLALAILLAPASEPAARAETPTPTPVETPAPTPTPTPTPSPTPAPLIGSPVSPMNAHLSGDVYGYLPYWELTNDTLAYLDWNALSVLSLFSVTSTTGGVLDPSQPGYKAIVGTLGRSAIAAAKAAGVRVELTYASFGYDKNATFFGDPARQAVTVAALRALVADLGVDGVNVDVELIKSPWFAAYAAFVGTLRATLRADNPAASVSVATNGNTSGALMAKAAADAGADRIFLMGYAYRTGSSAPGAIAPIDGRSSPGGLDLRWTIDRYAAEGVPLGRVILGLPYYGISWPTASADLGAARTGTGSTYLPRRYVDRPDSLGVPLQYEPEESVSWYAWYDAASSTWRQVFYDTPASLRPKYALAISRGLAGVGIWALGYDRGASGYWDLLKSMFGPPRVATLAVAPGVTRGLAVTAWVTATPGSRPVTEVRFSADGKAWGAWQPLPAPAPADPAAAPAPPPAYAVAISGAGADGRRTVWAQVRDEGGTASKPRTATVVLDRTGPTFAAPPELWFSGTSGSWRARWKPANDAHGPIVYRVRYAVNGGPWKIAALYATSTSIALPLRSRGTKVAVQVRAMDGLGNWSPASITRR